MKLATFEKDGRQCVGVVVADRIVPLGHASMLDFIGKGAAALDEAREAAQAPGDRGLALSSVTLLAPIPRPAKNVFCVGRNYKLHIEEGARANNIPVKFPLVPEFFTKPPTAVIGTYADIRLPSVTQKLDYEVELACVISRTGRDIPAANAGEYIFGFTVLNDITARDLQRGHGQWFKGKALDGSCPTGPWIVTADAFDARGDQRIWLTVNGEKRQDSVISDMLFDCAQIIEHLSAGLTLEAGDIITTGTPSGVGMGLDPQIWLKNGDVIEAGIEGIGSIINTVRSPMRMPQWNES